MARVSFVLALLIALIAVPTALASQGGVDINKVGTTVKRADGSRAAITGSASVPSNSWVLASVRVEETDHIGLMQAGETHQGKDVNSICAPPGSTYTAGYFVEHIHDGGTPLGCDMFSGTFGSDQMFAVFRDTSSSGFYAHLNGNYLDGPFQLAFPNNGIALIAGEWQVNPPNSFSFTYGPTSGQHTQPWSWTYNYTAVWNNVAGSDPWYRYNDGGWSFGNPPSPINMNW